MVFLSADFVRDDKRGRGRSRKNIGVLRHEEGPSSIDARYKTRGGHGEIQAREPRTVEREYQEFRLLRQGRQTKTPFVDSRPSWGLGQKPRESFGRHQLCWGRIQQGQRRSRRILRSLVRTLQTTCPHLRCCKFALFLFSPTSTLWLNFKEIFEKKLRKNTFLTLKARSLSFRPKKFSFLY